MIIINYNALLIAKPIVKQEGSTEEGGNTMEKVESELGVTVNDFRKAHSILDGV